MPAAPNGDTMDQTLMKVRQEQIARMPKNASTKEFKRKMPASPLKTSPKSLPSTKIA